MIGPFSSGASEAGSMDSPTFNSTGKVVASDVNIVLLVQVFKLNEHACTDGGMITSVARDDILADVAQTIHDECFSAAPSAKDRRVCA